MQELLQLVVSGIASGGIFASLALALVLIYNAMGLVNFAQGEMAMFATFIAYALIEHGLSYWIALPLTLALAFVGDVIPYERRQQVLGRFLSGQILGQMFGQAAGGVLGDYFGWRNVFFILAALLAIATLGLFYELWRNPVTRVGHAAAQPGGGFVADYSMVLRSPWSRMVIAVAFIEAAALFGAFTYVGADLHLRFGVNFALVGLFVGTFAVGGLIYSISVRVLFDRFGPVGLATGGVVFDRFSAVPLFLAAAAMLLGLGLWFARQLQRRRALTA
jgi:predicted MFS family arabinose efflux permease